MSETELAQANLEKLKARRKTLRSELTRFKTFLSECKQNPEKKRELKLRYDKYVNTFAKLDELQQNIESMDETEITNPNRIEVENNYFACAAEAEELIQLMHGSNALENAVQSSGLPIESQAAISSVKLPQMSLPEFDGRLTSWLQFRDTFKALIDNNPNLDRIQKFYYLQGALKGEAASVISSLEVSSDNYKEAWDLLNARFNNERFITKTHLKGLMELPSITRDSFISIRKFMDEFQKHFRALGALGEKTEEWGTLLIYLLTCKFDSNTLRAWEIEISQKTGEIKIKDLINFLNERCNLLQSIENNKSVNVQQNRSNSGHKTYANLALNEKCKACDETHSIYRCKLFSDMPTLSKIEKIKELGGCTNCLSVNHTFKLCKSKFGCKRCSKRHHTLLHIDSGNESNPVMEKDANKKVHVNYNRTNKNNMTLLATAIVLIKNKEGEYVRCRALLDSGSQSNFMTYNLFAKLNIPYTRVIIPIVGINNTTSTVNKIASVNIKSNTSDYQKRLQFFVINRITDKQPSTKLNINDLKLNSDITLSDAAFHIPSDIDILLGAEIYFEILLMQQRNTCEGLILQNSKLGWLVSGATDQNKMDAIHCNLITNEALDQRLESFWSVENEFALGKKIYTLEEQECENHFVDTHTRNQEGRFVVKLPLKQEPSQLGISIDIAVARFLTLERKLNKQPKLKEMYSSFIKEYENLNHMSRVNENDLNTDQVYYLPHHCVLKESSVTTKLRVVFNASAKTSSGLSLNDILMVGPTIQRDLFSILVKFRKHKVVVTADIGKMYRQVEVSPEHQNLQRILWRYNASDELIHFVLRTLTYGTAPASFIATRCLKQLSIENKDLYPQSSNAILNDFYIDDFISGADTVPNAKKLVREVDKILVSGGFHLRQWRSNNRELFSQLGSDDDNKLLIITDDRQCSKTLGVGWDSVEDTFTYSTNINTQIETKRSLLSVISQIFDPLGLLSPIVITAKLLIQQLWQIKLNWDDEIPEDIGLIWRKYSKDLCHIDKLKIDRGILVVQPDHIEMHCFGDASESAYGACIYLKSVNKNETKVRLIAAKTRVAPLKKLTLPRLELCASLLAAELSQSVSSALDLQMSSVYYWTDSTISLAWIRSDPGKFKTFVANRVAKIHKTSLSNNWLHVPGVQNPADLLTRGINPAQLVDLTLWWTGPEWLLKKPELWPKLDLDNDDREVYETETRTVNVMMVTRAKGFDLFDWYSSYNKLVRITALLFRFINNCKKHTEKITDLNIDNLSHACKRLVRVSQLECFPSEFEALENNEELNKASSILNLDPFLDPRDGVIRVGGRLRNSDLPYSAKHQMILHDKHKLTKLIINNEHLKNLHAGPQTLLALVRQLFWPLKGRRTIRSVLSKCITCFKTKPKPIMYKMANLPSDRVTQSRPFSNVGIDYAGPYLIKDSKFRNRKFIKAYICLFVCFSTKALHLELVTDLTTENFLDALKRFASRRGFPLNVYSDNATNFVGAERVLRGLWNELLKNTAVKTFALEHDFKWHFIPPRSPHFGGIWESLVKRVKYHLSRVLGETRFSYEKFYTLLSQIEAIINSRPLMPMSDNPNDLEALTPAHFLVGSSLMGIPETGGVDGTPVKMFNHLQNLKMQFWSRWSTEYLQELQQRSKWATHHANVRIGQLVLVMEDGLPPQHWMMARIIATHAGKDEVIRAATVKTYKGEFKRSTKKLCLLPIENEDS